MVQLSWTLIFLQPFCCPLPNIQLLIIPISSITLQTKLPQLSYLWWLHIQNFGNSSLVTERKNKNSGCVPCGSKEKNKNQTPNFCSLLYISSSTFKHSFYYNNNLVYSIVLLFKIQISHSFRWYTWNGPYIISQPHPPQSWLYLKE